MTGLATYQSTIEITAGEVIRTCPADDKHEAGRGWCVIRDADGGEVWTPYTAAMTQSPPAVGDTWPGLA